MTNLGLKHAIMRRSFSYLSGRRQIQRDTRRGSTTISKQSQMSIVSFSAKGIVHKEFVPPGQNVNADFYCNILRRLEENVRRKVQSNSANIPVLCTMTTRPPTCHSLCGSFCLLGKWKSSPPLRALKRSRPTRRTWWRCWREITSTSASDHGNCSNAKGDYARMRCRRIKVSISG
jgi:hypothetical protein